MVNAVPKRRRWLRFSLRTMFVFVTALACWLGYNANRVAHRKAVAAIIESHGGYVQPYASIARITATGGDCAVFVAKAQARSRPMNSAVRKWLGDVDAAWIIVGSQPDVELAREAFPEAGDVTVIPSFDSTTAE